MPLPLNLALFVVAAAAIWWAGTRLERLTAEISRRTGLGNAFAGLVLLAAATSLPEIATTITAVLRGNVELAVHNLMGGVAFQVVVLVIADATGRRGALTRFAPSFGLLTGGVGVVLMLGLAIAALGLAGDAQFVVSLGPANIGLNPALLVLPVAYAGLLRLTHRAEGTPRWRPVNPPPDDEPGLGDGDGDRRGWRLSLAYAGLGLLVTAAGWAAATSADTMAQQTGLSSGFVGATLLAAATSLPEISTTVSAVRHGNEDLAISNIWGSNGFDVALLALVSVLAGGFLASEPMVSAMYTGAVGAVLTCLYLWGLLERSDRTVSRVGVDSIAVAAVYLAGMGALYGLR